MYFGNDISQTNKEKNNSFSTMLMSNEQFRWQFSMVNSKIKLHHRPECFKFRVFAYTNVTLACAV